MQDRGVTQTNLSSHHNENQVLRALEILRRTVVNGPQNTLPKGNKLLGIAGLRARILVGTELSVGKLLRIDSYS